MSRLEIGEGLKVGDTIKVIGGPFANMYGKVKNLETGNSTIEVVLDLFGQETIVELELSEIEQA